MYWRIWHSSIPMYIMQRIINVSQQLPTAPAASAWKHSATPRIVSLAEGARGIPRGKSHERQAVGQAFRLDAQSTVQHAGAHLVDAGGKAAALNVQVHAKGWRDRVDYVQEENVREEGGEIKNVAYLEPKKAQTDKRARRIFLEKERKQKN